MNKNYKIKMARWFIIIGALLIIVGIIIYLAPCLITWFGKLPGDIHIEKGNTKLFFPITSMIVISIILSVIINLIKHLQK